MDGPSDIMIASKQVFSFSATFRFNLSRELNSKCARNEARVSPFKIKTKTCAAAADTGCSAGSLKTSETSHRQGRRRQSEGEVGPVRTHVVGSYPDRSTFVMGILEKIAEIEREIARTQKNKGELVRSMHDCSSSFYFDNYCHMHTLTNIIRN